MTSDDLAKGDMEDKANETERLGNQPQTKKDDLRPISDKSQEEGQNPTLTSVGTIIEPGVQVGSYKVLSQLGEGGFGVVYLAEQRSPVRRQVALKVIKPGMDSRQVIARFERMGIVKTSNCWSAFTY